MTPSTPSNNSMLTSLLTIMLSKLRSSPNLRKEKEWSNLEEPRRRDKELETYGAGQHAQLSLQVRVPPLLIQGHRLCCCTFVTPTVFSLNKILFYKPLLLLLQSQVQYERGGRDGYADAIARLVVPCPLPSHSSRIILTAAEALSTSIIF